MSRILLIDDEPSLHEVLKELLEHAGYEVCVAEDGTEGLRLLKIEPVDLVFLDFRLPGKGGFEVLQEIKSNWPDLAVVLMSGHVNVENAVKAIKLGAYDYLEKPLDTGRIFTVVRNAIQLEKLKQENITLQKKQFLEDEMIGETEDMVRIREIIRQSAPSNSRVMILGENGTGKELVARMIHLHSGRSKQNFVEVNCAAIPSHLIESELFGHEKGAFTGALVKRRGKFEMADGGTLFLDEVADMSLDAQAKMLRAIQEMTFERVGGEDPIHVDVRIVSATNKNLLDEIQAGRFREDLYFRLNVIPLTIPSLRERSEDIPALIDYFQRSYGRNQSAGRSFSPEAMKLIMEYSWPGNIRELKNFIERVLVLVDEAEISEEVAQFYLDERGKNMSGIRLENDYDTMKLSDAKEQFESQVISECLVKHNFNIAQTSQSLGIYPNTLHRKIKKYGIEIRR